VIHINIPTIKAISKGANSKTNKGRNNTTLYSIYASSALNYNDMLREATEYEMGNWVEHTTKWIQRKPTTNTKKYGRGTIVMLDFGATNYGSEPSYQHPAVIIAENTLFVLVVPGSSKKYGRGFSDVIDANTSDGFYTNTGVQSKSYRWVSKSRIDSIVGKASSKLLDEIDESILKDVPTHKKLIHKYKCDIENLKNEKEELQNKIRKYEKIITTNENAIKLLEAELTEKNENDIIKVQKGVTPDCSH
jgi:mRNA-degrading endonuclease toxin of MazEF toxin-antitoxin module